MHTLEPFNIIQYNVQKMQLIIEHKKATKWYIKMQYFE